MNAMHVPRFLWNSGTKDLSCSCSNSGLGISSPRESVGWSLNGARINALGKSLYWRLDLLSEQSPNGLYLNRLHKEMLGLRKESKIFSYKVKKTAG